MRKDATITVRVPRPTRRRLEVLAKREGRSLSQQIGRLIDAGLEREEGPAVLTPGGAPPLAGLLAGGPVPEYGDFRAVRTLLSASLLRRGGLGRLIADTLRPSGTAPGLAAVAGHSSSDRRVGVPAIVPSVGVKEPVGSAERDDVAGASAAVVRRLRRRTRMGLSPRVKRSRAGLLVLGAGLLIGCRRGRAPGRGERGPIPDHGTGGGGRRDPRRLPRGGVDLPARHGGADVPLARRVDGHVLAGGGELRRRGSARAGPDARGRGCGSARSTRAPWDRRTSCRS